MNFCHQCQNRLETCMTSDSIIHECFACKQTYSSKPENTLIYKREYKIDTTKSKRTISKILKNTAHMDDNIKSDISCAQCGEKNTKYTIMGDDMDRHFVCKCGNIWVH